MPDKHTAPESGDVDQPHPPTYQRVGAIIRDPAIWLDVERVDAETIDGSEIVVHDAMFLPGSKGNEPGDYAVMLISSPRDFPTSDEKDTTGKPLPQNARTTSLGGEVVVRKLKAIMGIEPKGQNQLPVVGMLIKQANRAGTYEYWDLR